MHHGSGMASATRFSRRTGVGVEVLDVYDDKHGQEGDVAPA
jgi:hypothetical protein